MQDIPPSTAAALVSDDVEVPPIPWHAKLRSKLSPRYVYSMLDQVVFSFGNLIVYATFKRHTTFAEYGIFYLALRSIDVLNQLSSVLIWGPATYNLPLMKEEGRFARYMGSNLVHQIFANLFAVFVFALLAGVSRMSGSTMYSNLFTPLIFSSIALIFRDYARHIYFAQMRFREALLTDIAVVTLQITGVMYLVRTNTLNYRNALWELSLGCALVVAYTLFMERRSFQFSAADILPDFKLNLKLGRWFFGSNMIFLGSQQANSWILNGVLGPSSVGNYAICEQVMNFPRVAIVSIQNAMGPSMAHAFANGGKSELRKVVRRMDLLLTGGSAAMAVFTVFFGSWVSGLIFHARAEHARWILIFLSLNLVTYAGALSKSYGLSALNRAEWNVYAGAIGLVMQLIASFLVVFRWGATGVAFAVFFGNLVVWLARILYYRREMRRP